MQPHGRFSEKITIRGLMAVGLPPDLSYEAVCTSNDVQFYNAGQVKFRILFKTCIEHAGILTCTVPLCPSSVWFMLRLEGAARPFTLEFLTGGNKCYMMFETMCD